MTTRAFTHADLVDQPDDGRNYELSYGAVIVSPRVDLPHQRVLARLARLLATAAPADRIVLAGAELFISDTLVKRPDLMVVDPAAVDGRRVTGVPDLVVEVHTRWSRLMDITEKRWVYAERGIPEYWMVDPARRDIIVLRLVDGDYHEDADGGIDRSAVFS